MAPPEKREAAGEPIKEPRPPTLPAGYGLFGMVEEITEQQLRDQLEVKLSGVLHVTQAVLPVLREQGSGYIIQISTAGGIAAFPSLGGYHASKWALEGMT